MRRSLYKVSYNLSKQMGLLSEFTEFIEGSLYCEIASR